MNYPPSREAVPSNCEEITSLIPKFTEKHVPMRTKRKLAAFAVSVMLAGVMLLMGSGLAQASTAKPVHVTQSTHVAHSAYATQCADYWDQNIGWSGAYKWNDTVYAGYCWNGYQVWHRYGPDCSTSVDWQGIGGSPYGNDTTACYTSGDWTDQLQVGYNWSWYVYSAPWAKYPGNNLRFTVNADGQIIARGGQAGV